MTDHISLSENHFLIRQLGLSDFHIHTGFGYCSPFLVPYEVILLAHSVGLRKIAFTEHAAQLYVSEDDYWSGRFVDAPSLFKENEDTPLDRMKAYREKMSEMRSEEVLLGLEVEVDCNGCLTLMEKDRSGWDILLGAVHFLPACYGNDPKEGFMWAVEKLLQHDIEILAHPFRYFYRNGLPAPKELYKPVVELLIKYHTAAELNFNGNENDPAFFKLCMENNVPISLGSDTHDTDRTGDLRKHFEFMNRICPIEQLPRILYG